jgi:hypothetical protein
MGKKQDRESACVPLMTKGFQRALDAGRFEAVEKQIGNMSQSVKDICSSVTSAMMIIRELTEAMGDLRRRVDELEGHRRRGVN